MRELLSINSLFVGQLYEYKSLALRSRDLIVQEPVIGLIKWSRPKGLKVCSDVEKCAEFKN